MRYAKGQLKNNPLALWLDDLQRDPYGRERKRMTHAEKQADHVIKFLKKHNAWWLWDNHRHLALLTSGKVSDFYADCTPIFTDPQFQNWCAETLAPRFNDLPEKANMWVVGSAYGAIGLAQSLACNRLCKAAYTQSSWSQMALTRFDLGEKPYVILCEDVISTGGTTKKTIAGILEKHKDVEFHEEILCIINRSNSDEIEFQWDGVPTSVVMHFGITSIVEVSPNVWEADAIPEQYSKCRAIRPKGHWTAMQEKL